MAAFFHRHAYTGRRSPSELVERLRCAPAGIAAGPEVEARRAARVASSTLQIDLPGEQ